MYTLPLYPPQSWTEPLVIPLIFTFFGVLVFILGLIAQKNRGKPVWWKWIGLGVLVLGVIFGSRHTYWYFGPDSVIYAGDFIMKGNRMRLAHSMSMGLPFLSIVACLVTMVLMFRQRNEDDFGMDQGAIPALDESRSGYPEQAGMELDDEDDYDLDDELLAEYEEEPEDETPESPAR